MKAHEFCYWLQGFFEIKDLELAGSKWTFNNDQIRVIRQHLALAFKHDIDPKYGDDEHQQDLNNIHGGPGSPSPTFRC